MDYLNQSIFINQVFNSIQIFIENVYLDENVEINEVQDLVEEVCNGMYQIESTLRDIYIQYPNLKREIKVCQ